MTVLRGKKILYGITGSVSAYKAIEVIRRLKDEGASVDVVMTKSSLQFIPALAVRSACDVEVYTDLFDPPMSHIKLPEEADLFLIAPATANIIGKYSSGVADDLLSTMLLVFSGKVVFAPAMNYRMYENPIVHGNIQRLKEWGVHFIEPETGPLACGESGKGRLAETGRILETLKGLLTKKDLMGHKILVTAGPTREFVDPVRFISNRSSGKMGYAIAVSAKRRGAEVTLISGPVALKKPYDIETIYVETAAQMYEQTLRHAESSSIVVMAAAVADYTPLTKTEKKLQKQESLALELKKTEDILRAIASLRPRPFVVGFSAQTGKEIQKAREKLYEKGVDMIIFNDVLEPGSGFDVDTNKVTLLFKSKEQEVDLPQMSKEELAEVLLDYVLKEYECHR